MENKNIKVSVVIPVYNTEKYVREAVESIMRQSLKELEIIIINDGSTDGSLHIAEELKSADNRIKIYSQANQGLSMARNAGILHAHGTYIYFMDSDDLLEKDAMQLCYRKCEEEKLDFVFFDAQSFFDGNLKNAPSLSYNRTDKLEDRTYTGDEALKTQLENREYTPSACLNFIRRSFLEKNGLRFYPGIVHEDQLFTTLLYLQAGKTACIKRTFFQRRMRENSIMTGKFTNRNIEGYLTVTREILDFKKRTVERKNGAIIDLYLSQMLDAAMWQAHTLRLPERLRLAWLCLHKYRKYVSARTIGTLLFKSLLTNR
ncbi:glycosyltransferase [Bacteroides congonensis]|uniref:glycosyltransferase family 2 protein n=1 Tax=Bacteroides TaxID=816 RepID=UPI002674D375|nr:glycosyltransferase [Bacteroides congonensis]